MQGNGWLRDRVASVRARLADPEQRVAIFGILFIFFAYVLQLIRCSKLHTMPHGDGFGSWVYAASLALDNDIDFTNDYAVCGFAEPDRGGGRPANHFYFGPALIWTPLLKLAKALITLPPGATPRMQRACEGPWPWFVAAWTPLFTTLTIYFSYRVATRFVKPTFAMMGAFVGAFGTTLVTYGSIVWFYCHMWSALGVALTMLTGFRAIEEPEKLRRWVLFGMCLAFAALMRPQEGVWCLLAAPWFLRTVYKGVQSKPRSLKLPLLAAGLTIVGFASVYWIQLYIYKKMFGVYWLVPQGTMYVQLRHAHPWLTAFGPFSGLFTYTPLVYLGVFGFIIGLRNAKWRWMTLAIIIPALVDCYVSSAALMWNSGGSWGMRTMTSVAPAVVVFSAVFLERAYAWVMAKKIRRQVVLSTLIFGPWAFITMGLPFVGNWDKNHWAPNAYSVALKANLDQMYEAVGNPVNLPANAVFAARYRLHPKHMSDLIHTGFYQVYYVTGDLQIEGTLNFAVPNQYIRYAEGCEQTPEGVRVRAGQRCRWVMTMYWPWITHLRIAATVHGDRPAVVRMRSNGFWTGQDLGSRTYAPGPNQPIEWSVPENAITSGLNEIVLESDRDLTLQTMEFMEQPLPRRAGRPFRPDSESRR
ncbi:MAG: hypothetical protein JNK05_13735 [Myxococcales bacterium]|nr:hypothetical protein [Myxococcales bacterium]